MVNKFSKIKEYGNKITTRLSRPLNDSKIRKYQSELLKENYNPNTKKLIIFLTSGYDMVNGGILSISSMYEETIKLKEIHGAETIKCIVPGEPLILKYTKFKNQDYIYNFTEILSFFGNLDSLIIHIPEYACRFTFDKISKEEYSILDKIKDLHINILMQNIDVANDQLNKIKGLKQKFNNITGTMAHENYTNLENRQKFGFPIHKFSTYVSPEQYHFKTYIEKENILIVSQPEDEHPSRTKVLKLLRNEFPEMEIKVIENITYDEFKKVISKSKWALTFGEGLDGYFIEPIFSGAIAFSVFNSRFFTKDFKSLETVYNDYEELIKKMPMDLKRLDSEKYYKLYQEQEFERCSKYYDYNEYIENLKLFYQGEYTYK